MQALGSTDSAAQFLSRSVNLNRYPLHEPGSSQRQEAIAQVRAELKDVGCSVLRGFLTESAIENLQAQADALRDKAHYRTIRTNPYSSPDDESLPEGHPVRTFLERNNAFVAADLIPNGSHLRRMYSDPSVKRFLAECLEEPEIHEYADPFAKLVLNVLTPGSQHPWHYDTNEFIVSTLVTPAEGGGTFEYCPSIRSPETENYAAVANVLHDRDRSAVRALDLRAGDLQLFLGRYSLHRVTRVEGSRDRITAIFAYAKQANVIGRVERTRRLFGRVSPIHEQAELEQHRSDNLRD